MMSTDNESPRILRVAETASTNSLLRELVIKESLAEGSVVVADFQTAGRGQIGNTWESEAGKNLMFSLVLYPTCIPANRQFLISQIAALSVPISRAIFTISRLSMPMSGWSTGRFVTSCVQAMASMVWLAT